MDVVECPFCDTKYDISKLKDGSELKCTGCNKVVGTIKNGYLLPMFEKYNRGIHLTPPKIKHSKILTE